VMGTRVVCNAFLGLSAVVLALFICNNATTQQATVNKQEALVAGCWLV
jgi:uncharacterized lipoprotein NlpE involved in copper resistance